MLYIHITSHNKCWLAALCIIVSRFHVLPCSTTELPLYNFISFLDALEWPDTSVLLSVEAVPEAKLEYVSEWSCTEKTTDL